MSTVVGLLSSEEDLETRPAVGSIWGQSQVVIETKLSAVEEPLQGDLQTMHTSTHLLDQELLTLPAEPILPSQGDFLIELSR